jgi:NhaP-type Na+/H+ or K+/H+ antiporter
VLLIVLALSVLRFAWVWLSLKMTFIGALHRGDVPPSSSLKLVLVATLAGVRGTVTLAGVLTLPLLLASGSPFPSRDLAIALAAGVIVVSLLLASVVLPGLLRGLEMPPEPSHRRAEDSARQAGAEAAVLAIEGALQAMLANGDDRRRCNEAAARITALYRQRIGRWGHHDSPAARAAEDQVERQLRRVGLAAERTEILRLGASHAVGDLWLRRVVRELDLQEARFGAGGGA